MSVKIPPEWKILLVFGLVYVSLTSSRVHSEGKQTKTHLNIEITLILFHFEVHSPLFIFIHSSNKEQLFFPPFSRRSFPFSSLNFKNADFFLLLSVLHLIHYVYFLIK